MAFVARAQVLWALAILCGGGFQPPTYQIGALTEEEWFLEQNGRRENPSLLGAMWTAEGDEAA